MHTKLPILSIVIFCISAIPSLAAPAISVRDIQPSKELLITNARVLQSEHARFPGAWSFGGLMTELFGPADAPAATRDWLETMAIPTVVDKQRVDPRPRIRELVIEPWQRRDGFDPHSREAWLPKFENAPFRLLAIVNRIDLGASALAKPEEAERLRWRAFGREDQFDRLLSSGASGRLFRNIQPARFTPNRTAPRAAMGWGGGAPAAEPFVGEGRLVFCVTDGSGAPLAGGWTVIFEYRLPQIALRASALAGKDRDNPDVDLAAAWAWRWHALADIDIANQRFPDALAELTTGFTHRKPGGNAAPTLAQLRSNDGACGPGREFRQFALNGTRLLPVVLPGTPAPSFMEAKGASARALAEFLADQTPLIKSGLGGLPLTLDVRGESVPLLGAVARIPDKKPDFHWDFGAMVPKDSRRLISMNSCNGCHAGETSASDGMHIRPAAGCSDAGLSAWLGAGREGIRVDDPGFKNSRVHFQEMEDRRVILAALLGRKERALLADLRETLRDRLRRGH